MPSIPFEHFKEHITFFFIVYSETIEVENTDDRWKATSKRTNSEDETP